MWREGRLRAFYFGNSPKMYVPTRPPRALAAWAHVWAHVPYRGHSEPIHEPIHLGPLRPARGCCCRACGLQRVGWGRQAASCAQIANVFGAGGQLETPLLSLSFAPGARTPMPWVSLFGPAQVQRDQVVPGSGGDRLQRGWWRPRHGCVGVRRLRRQVQAQRGRQRCLRRWQRHGRSLLASKAGLRGRACRNACMRFSCLCASRGTDLGSSTQDNWDTPPAGGWGYYNIGECMGSVGAVLPAVCRVLRDCG